MPRGEGRPMRCVVALGGNALSPAGDDGSVTAMRAAVAATTEVLADLVERGVGLVITHGNGPQVGRILLQQEYAAEHVPPMPMDVCGAQSQGQIGYVLAQSLDSAMQIQNMAMIASDDPSDKMMGPGTAANLTPLFAGAGGGPLSARQVHRRVSDWAERAGITRSVGPHALRHVFGQRLFNATGNVILVAKAMCHRSITSSQTYVHADGEMLRKALGA